MSRELDLSKPLDQDTINELLRRHPVEKVQYLVEQSQSGEFQDDGDDVARQNEARRLLADADRRRQEEEFEQNESERQLIEQRRADEEKAREALENDSDDGSGSQR